MFDIRADVAKNRLYFTLGAISGKAERDMIIEKTFEASKKLLPGFTCLSDLRNFRLVDSDDEGFMRECQVILWEAAIGKVVRVSEGGKVSGHFNFEKQSLVWPAYWVTAACTIEDAEAILDGADTAMTG